MRLFYLPGAVAKGDTRMHRMTLIFLAGLSVGAAQPIPRPEFPQPQFQREQWLNLNGPWEFEFDDGNRGSAEDWASGGKAFSRHITVPFCFESARSGIADTSFHPWAWYKRSVTIPGDWKGRRVLLHFGAVDYRAMVWVNGRFAGRHEGGNTPFQLDITELLKPGANGITVRAEDPPTDRYIPRGKQYWELKSASIFYTRTSGIWQTVWLEATGDSYLARVRITPAVDGTVRFDAAIARPAPVSSLWPRSGTKEPRWRRARGARKDHGPAPSPSSPIPNSGRRDGLGSTMSPSSCAAVRRCWTMSAPILDIAPSARRMAAFC